MFAIDTENLSKSFGAVKAVDGLTLKVKEGEIYGLVGPDGAGKTTTLRLLSAVLNPDGGHGTVAGFTFPGENERIKEQISYMPQRFALYTDLTIQENIRFYSHIFNVPGPIWKRRAEELLRMSGLYPFRNRLVQKLSGGMKQKLALICALIHIPKVLLLDEPTNGVDPVSRRDFWKILYGLLREGVTILITTAYLDEAERCNRIGLLHAGRMLLEGSPASIKAQFPYQVLEIYTSERNKAQPVLERIDGVFDVIVTGDRVHVHVDQAQDREPAIRDALTRAEIHLGAICHTPPTLEDLFISLIERSRGEE